MKPRTILKTLSITPSAGRVAVLTPGMGAVATTFFAGVEAVKLGLAKPIGSYTQMGQVRLGKRLLALRLLLREQRRYDSMKEQRI